MSYAIRFRPRVERQLAALPANVRVRILRRIDALAEDPHPRGVEALEGDLKGRLRVRVGNYRVIYRVLHDEQAVLISSAGHRGKVYRDAERHG